MGQIVSVIRQCLPLCFPLPESEHQNEASQVVGIEDKIVASQVVGVQDQNEDEEAAEATAGEEDDDDVAFQANRDARVTVIARCEVDSMTDGCQWGIYEVTTPTKEYHITIHVYVCIVDPDCPVWKYVGRCSEDMSIHVTTYYGTHNHPLPVGSITAMASAASADFFRLLDSSNRLSEGTYSFTKASLPYDMNDPNDPSQGIVVDLTSQFPMPNSPVRDQDQNEPHKILVGEGSKKEDEAAEATAGEEDDHDVASHANKEARFTIIARCEEASMKDGCQWGICGVPSPTKEYPFPLHIYGCIVDPDCPVWKLVWRCSEDMSILITTYYGIHNHPLPFGSITAMASTASYDPPQFPMPKSPVRDQDQNQPPIILVGEDSKKDVESSSTTISTSFSEPHWNYDVFLSFRGEDTRKNFTDHLYSALEGVGIRTFRDNEELEKGKAISNELLNAIHASRISIVVFSEGYASSSWCLDELVEIVHCKNTIGHTLLPIFYQVDPSNVRKQTGTFAEAFARHEKFEMERIQRWRKALTEAGNCSGWDLERVANGYESRFIKEIVEEVLCKVNPAHLDVAKHPIGMESRVHHIKDLLNLGTSDVRIVGIYGMGGIGKTTLAKAVYNEICIAFEGSSFLSNLKESSEKPNGLVHLQEQLLNDILKTNLKIGDVDRGISIIEERLHGKKVLVVLDDVDDFENLHTLVKKQWFHPGSRIIVTTRDEHLLTQLEVHKKYKVEELNYWESLQLFSYHAFGTALPIDDYQELSSSAVTYVGGLPLALVVLGSFLKGRSIDEWKSELKKLRRTPHGKIQKILRISYDSLDRSTKDIFLDIACFFVGMDKEYAIKILDGCNFFPGIGMPILIQRSLVTIDCGNGLKMHNLVRHMGREIVCEESPNYLGKRSRLWFHKDILNVLDNRMGSKRVEGLILHLPVLEDVYLTTEAFTNMKNLRLLQINSVHLRGSYEHLSKELKWLCWHKCPLEFLPQSFHLENIVILDIQNSNVKQVWKKNKIFNKLKVLNLSNSIYLTKSPDFSQVPQLEILILEGCTSLVKVHKSIGYVKRLVSLSLKNCTILKDLPRSISNLESLETLDLSGCSALEKLPSFGLLKNLKTISLYECSRLTESPNFLAATQLEHLVLEGCTSLVEIHESIGYLKGLNLLDLQRCENLRNLPINISKLESLKTLLLSRCLNLERLPEQLGSMTALTVLKVENTTIKQLPSSFSLLTNLETLSLLGCDCLIESPEFLQTSRLKELILAGCTSLVEVHKSIGLLKRLVFLDLSGCKKLMNLPSNISNLELLETLSLYGCECLIESPEFLQTSSLEMLILAGCTSLVEVHKSIGLLKRLVLLNLGGCKNLMNLPSKISNLERLETLLLPDCLEEDNIISEILTKRMELKILDRNRAAITQQQSSSSPFRNPATYSLSRCKGASSSWISPKSSNYISVSPFISELCSLTWIRELDLSGRNLCEDDFPIEFGCLSSLHKLDLSRNNFRNLPDCIGGLPSLYRLHLNDCTNLQSISIHIGVKVLKANGCTLLERVLTLADESLGSFLRNRITYINSVSDLRMGRCNNLSPAFRETVLQMMCKADVFCSICLPGSEIPNWISHQTIGSLISFCVPSFWGAGKVSKLVVWVVYAANEEAPKDFYRNNGFVLYFRNKTRHPGYSFPNPHGTKFFYSFEDHIFVEAMRFPRLDHIVKSGDEIEVKVSQQIEKNKCGIQVKKCGIHLVDEPNVIDEDDVRSYTSDFDISTEDEV